MRVLYLSYDGALDPLGRSQVVPYLEGLAERGHDFDLLTFEKPDRLDDAEAVGAMSARLEEAGVAWHPLRYHKRPPVASTAWDLAAGRRAAARIVRERRPDLLHARSYPPALLARRVAGALGIPWLFDMRGLWADERVDGGLWRAGGLLHQITRRVERDLLGEASAVVTLTRASLPVVRERLARAGAPDTPVEVIPTCVDMERFRPRTGPGSAVLAYFGSVGTWYMIDEMARLGRAWVDGVPEGRLLFLINQGEEDVRAAVAGAGVPAERLEVRSVPHERVPHALADAAATFFLIRPAPSKIASAATKFGESLALGLPVILNDGVGDSATVAREEGVGVVVDGFEPEAYVDAVARMRARLAEPGIADRCRTSALAHYDLGRGVDAYDGLYRELAG